MQNIERFAPLVLRIGIALVFFWFGSQQLMNPSVWVGFVPEPFQDIFIPVETLVRLNGWAEIVLAFMLVMGFWLRVVGVLLFLHLFMIAVDTGGAIGVRDFGLSIASLTVALLVPDTWSVDAYFEKKRISA